MVRYNAYSYLGSDAPDVVESSQANLFQENMIVGSLQIFESMDAVGTQFVGNSFENAVTIRFDDATRTVTTANPGLNNTKRKVNNGASVDEKSGYGYEPTY